MIKRFVEWRYRIACCVLGDMDSYWYLGKPIGYEIQRDRVAFWTKMAKRFGIKIMTPDERIQFGGYGIEPTPREG